MRKPKTQAFWREQLRKVVPQIESILRPAQLIFRSVPHERAVPLLKRTAYYLMRIRIIQVKQLDDLMMSDHANTHQFESNLYWTTEAEKETASLQDFLRGEEASTSQIVQSRLDYLKWYISPNVGETV